MSFLYKMFKELQSVFTPVSGDQSQTHKNVLHKQNCDIVVLNCKEHKQDPLLKKVKELAISQQSQFKPGYASELSIACDFPLHKGLEYYFVAVTRDKDQTIVDICGFAFVTKDDRSPLELETLASKSYTNVSYKGIGTLLINSIKQYFQNDPKIIGLSVHSRPEALPFYEKVGFQRLGLLTRDLFLPFERYHTYNHDDADVFSYHQSIAQQLNDQNTLAQLKLHNQEY